MGELQDWKRQGLHLTGRLAAVENATESVISSLNLGETFYGCALYTPDQLHAGELNVIHQNSKNTSADHVEFVQRELRRKRIVASSTSVGVALGRNKSGIYPSQMARHDCLNIVGETSSGQIVLQLAFKKGGVPDISDPERLLHIGSPGGSVFGTVQTLMQDYPNLSQDMSLSPPQEPNGVLMFSDISGYKKIIAEDGQSVAFQTSDALRAQIMRIADKYDGVVIREEGDGIWSGFSKLDERVLQAADEIQAAYRSIRNRDVSEIVRETHVRTAIATGYMDAVLDGDIFNPFIKYNSLAFISARLMSEAAPRDRDCIFLSSQASRVLSGLDDVLMWRQSVPSTFTPEMYEITFN